MTFPEQESHVAALDLGSNSFHMLVARPFGNRLVQVDRLRERVALAEGLQPGGQLSEEAQERALACLERFGERLRGFEPPHVRAVGTNTLRQSQESGFLEAAQEALGHPIEVISGAEEARLIYLGVANSVSDVGGRRLVVDIGGGSTEVVIGRRFQALITDSLYMGCISYTRRFFPEGRLNHEAFRDAEIAARLELNPIENRFKRSGWNQAIGASGTIRAVEAVLRENGWETQGITAKGLELMEERLCQCGELSKLDLPGLEPNRTPVIAGGLAILSGLFRSLEIDRMSVSKGALREGVLYDLLGRIHHHDVREETVRQFAERFHLDSNQAARVERTAMLLLDDVSEAWKLPEDPAANMLLWAARLHEVGMALSWAGHHRHGAYLIQNSHLPGFSRQDQRMLAALVHGHRRKLTPDVYEDLPKARTRLFVRLCALLRIAVCINRAREDDPVVPDFRMIAEGNKVRLKFGEDYLAARPLMRADLAQEAEYLSAVGIKLKYC